ncbi:uncharacterized protein LOC124137222 isoform X2 [Haliotis rufescens]|uniref:uncharacterized protein LOC124137222 isoform X2 n=1 Tax=Haliotis rufescens TaxID=6454 RepID=UPI00201E97FF|nr:uncharacterized protein LOC124137222 isoform X2 [Haliotis rufescens]
MPTTLPLSNLVDLALGTPEVGAVNFNVLHTLLHAMISKLNIRDVKADINESDRDFLSSTKSQRVMTGLSDIDSGKGEDSEDALSEIRDSSELDSPASSAKHKSKRSVPYHHLELRVEKLAEQLENLNALPTNSDLFERAKAKGDGERPIADMWQYMQLKKRVDANEEGVGKLMSLVEDLMKEMQTLRDTNSNLLDRINGLNIDELNKKLAALEKVTNDLNNKFSTLPTADDFAQFVTWPLLEDALKGVRKDLEELHGSVQEKVVTETGSQTDNRMPSRPSSSHHTSSRPPSSRPLSRLSTTSSGPTNELLDILERIGKLSESHDALTKRVEELEEQLKNKLDKEALEGLNISGDLMEQLNKLKEELDALQSMRDKLPTTISTSGSVGNKHMSMDGAGKIHTSQPPSDGESSDTGTISASEGPSLSHNQSSQELLAILRSRVSDSEAFEELISRVGNLEDNFKNLQQAILNPLAIVGSQQLPTTISTSGSVGNKHMSTESAGKIHTSQPPGDGKSSDTGTISASEVPSLSHNQSSQELLAILRSRASDSEAFEQLISRLGNLEDNYKNLQQAILNLMAIVGSQQLPTTISTSGSVGNKHMSTDGAGKIHTSQPPSDGKSSDTGTISASEGPSLSHNQSSQELLAILRSRASDSEAFEQLISRLGNLEDNFKNLQQAILNPMAIEDSGFSSEPFGDLPSCFSDMDEKIVMLSPVSSNVTDPASEGESKGQKKGSLKKGHDIGDSTEDESDTYNLNLGSELNRTNEKLKHLRRALDDQMGEVRNKIFALDHDLKRMAKGVEFALRQSRVKGLSNMDTDALSRAQKAILELQAELERLNNITQNIVEENEHRSKQIENLLGYCDTLQDKKADKEYVAMEVDVKADKRQLDNKVNRSVFENTTDEINKIIKEILDKLDGNESSWKDAVAQLADELEGKLDRLELDPLKEWLESRLKALNKKIMANAGNEWLDDDAAGLRKQLLQRFNCLSCDRPVDLMPTGPVQSLPSQNGLPPTRSPRPYTTYELDQIRQSAKRIYQGVVDKQHSSHQFRFNQQDVTDYYATSRQCGGNHTLTYPHKRVSRMTQMNNLFKEDADPAPAPVYPIYKEEVDVQGVDGHIYRGRVERMQIEAKMPSKISPQQSNQVAPISPATPRTLRKIPGLETDPVRGSPTPPTGMRGRPMSARGSASPRPVSGRVPSRPQSTQPTSAAQSGLELSRTTTPYQEDPMLQDGGPTDQGQITVESEAIRVDVPTPDMMEEQTEG